MRKKFFYLFLIVTFFFFRLNILCASETIGLSYSSYVQSKQWLDEVNNGEISGTIGKGLGITGINLKVSSNLLTGTVMYRSYVNNVGWQDYVSSGSVSGNETQGNKIGLIQIKLTEELAEKYNIYYRVHVSNIGWLDWASNDQITGSYGYNYQIEAIQVKILAKSEKSPGSTKDVYREKDFGISYSSYVQSKQWLDEVNNGEISGTVGKGLGITGINLKVSSSLSVGTVMYRSYVNSVGWQDYVSSGSVSGNETQGNKIGLIQIKLTEELAEKYNIYYRVHVSNIGWLDWASNDQITGSYGYNYQIEAIQVKILAKSEKSPGSTKDIYRENKLYLTSTAYIGSSWQRPLLSGMTIGGEENKNLLEAINISIYNNTGVSGDLEYSSHIGGIGWQDYVSSGNISGIVGTRLEAIKIRLTGSLANLYSVYYKVYVEDYGWLDWAYDDKIAGTVSLSKKILGMKILILNKDENPPGKTEQSYLCSIFREIDGKKYYYSNGVPVTGFYTVMGIKYFSNSKGEVLAQNVKKIIDVSSHQKQIDWTSVKRDSVDGAIIRLGYGTSYVTDACVEDQYFSTNYYATKSLNILSGIYLYSYAINEESAKLEANFVINRLTYYNIDKSIPIYYDLESNNWTRNLSSSDYDKIVTVFSRELSRYGYTVKVYTYKSLAENKFSAFVRQKIGWIAQYNDYCTYDGNYDGWQYTDKGSISGISGLVDVSVWLK